MSATIEALARRAFLDARIRTLAFAYLFAVAAFLNPVAYRHTYSTPQQRIAFANSFSTNKGVVLFYGKPYDLLTVGGYSAWRTGGILAVLGAIFGLLAVVRALRTEEDAGRADLVLSNAVSRRTLYGASMLAVGAGAGLLWLGVFLGSVIASLPAGGSAYLALAIVSMVPVFAGVGAVASQVAPTRRVALELGGGVVAVSFVLRLIADVSHGAGWVRWLTPLGWAEQLRPFTGAEPLVLLLPIAASVVLFFAAARLAMARDIGTGLLASRDTASPRLALLSSPTAQALRAERASLIVWSLGLGAFAFLIGVIAKSISAAGISPQLQRELAKLGSGSIVTPKGYLSFTFIFFALAISFFACAQIGTARQEESEQRLETLLVAPGRSPELAGRPSRACAHRGDRPRAALRTARVGRRGIAERGPGARNDARGRSQLPPRRFAVPRNRGTRLLGGATRRGRHRVRPRDGRVPMAADRVAARRAEVGGEPHAVRAHRVGADPHVPRGRRRGHGRDRAAHGRGGAGAVRPPRPDRSVVHRSPNRPAGGAVASGRRRYETHHAMPFSLRRRRLRSRDLLPDRYLTDGRRLLRVVSRLVNDGSVLVVIEDCLTLDARAYAAVELEPMGVRPVTPRRSPQNRPAAPAEPPAQPSLLLN